MAQQDEVAAALNVWRESLVNLTGINRLIKFKASKSGTVVVDDPGPQAVLTGLARNVLWRFQATMTDEPGGAEGDAWHLSRAIQGVRAVDAGSVLRVARTDMELGTILRNLMRRADTEFLDRGLHVLYAAIGMLHWSDDDGTAMQSPLLLVPVSLESEGPKSTPRLRAAEDDTVFNPALTLRLRDFGLTLPSIEDLDDNSIDSIFGAVRSAVSSHHGWEVKPTVVISCFSFHKEAMYRDLLDNEDAVLTHPIVRALATRDPGDQTDSFMFDELPPADIDREAPPEDTPMVLDADSSQRAAIAAAVAGRSFVMDGPPGTGKSQTIANVIGALLHAGKTVLFVSEKAAALEVVRNRLAKAGLGNYLLELHSHKASRKEVAATLAHALDNVPVPPQGLGSLDRHKLIEQRKRLNDYAAAMNEFREPLELSLHQVLGIMANLAHLPAAPIPEAPPAALSQADYQAVLDVATRLQRAWRPAAQGQSYLYRDVTDRSSLEIRLYQAQSALEELYGISQINQEAANAFGIRRPSEAQVLVSLIEQQGTRPVGVLDDWLTVADFEGITGARDILGRAIDAVAAAERGVLSVAGVAWDVLPAPHLIPEHPQTPAVSPAPVDIGNLTAETASAVADRFTADAAILRSRLDTVNELAERVGLSGVEKFDDLTRVLALIDLGVCADLPIRDWMSREGLSATQHAAHVLQMAIATLNEAETRALRVFTRDVLTAPTADLHDRFTNVHKGLRKLSGAYRRDKKAVTGLLTEGTTLNAGVTHLPHATAWQRAAAEYDAAVEQHADRLGHYWQGRDTDFAAHARGVEVAETALRLTPESAHDRVAGYLCDRTPPPAHEALSRDTRAEIETWQATLRPAPALAGRPDLLLGPIEHAAVWLDEHVIALTKAAERIRAVDRAIGGAVTLAQADDLLRLREAAATAHRQLEEHAAAHCAALAHHYRGVRTDLDRLDITLAWAKAVRVVGGGALTEAQTKALADIRPTDNLAAAVRKWTAARGRILDAFAGTRHDEISRELDDYRNAPEFIDDLRTDGGGQEEWFAYREARELLGAHGLDPAIDFCIEQNVPDHHVSQVLQRALLRAWADHIIGCDERLRPQRSADRSALVEEYRELDKRLIAAATSDIIRSANSRRPSSTAVGEPSVIRREGMKKSKHPPVRDLIGRTRNTSLAIKPCFMMSPLAVSQYLPSDMNFDVVIFDEASQVTPGDAINCVYRGKALILAGDDKQLPPTSFFERVVDDTEGDEETDINDFQSILELTKGCGAFNNLGLKWHYRSRHEALIAYSNHKFYEGKLVTYPSSHSEGPDVGVEFFPAGGTYRRGTTADNPAEAAKVAERVIEHFTTRPHLTLGVVTFSVAQADAIMDAVDKAREERRDLDRHFDTGDRLDAFFIKSLESVQGDERDVMIFSIGYGPDEAGKVSTNFGVLNKPKGWRRLNVAITRARQRIEVVSSMRAGDIPASQNENVQYLAAYLDYAERGHSALALETGPSGLGPESPVEESVIKTIRSWGYTVEPQVGAAGFRIDIGVRHPAHPGVFALGVECDGYQYHSAPAARDRDRLRDQVLRGLGWRLHRIWGTAWYRDRQREEDRLKGAIQAAITAPADGRVSSNRDHIERPRVTTEEVDPYATPSWTSDYITADVPPLPWWIDPGDPGSRFDMQDAIVEIARAEGPVHITLIHQRVRDAWNIGRIGPNIRENIDAAISLTDVIREGDFIDLPNRDVTAVRRPTNGVPRKVEQVPPGELTLAITSLLRDAGTTSRGDLVIAVARIFGWSRTGRDIGQAINSVIDRLVRAGTLTAADGAVSLPT